MRIASAVFTLSILNCLFAQQAIVRSKNANLREEPGTQTPPIAVLHAGDKITLLDPTPEHGFLQVETKDGTDGWISIRTIHVLASPSASQPALDPESATAGAPVTCDDTLWQHVYRPQRLIVKQQCIAVTGTIVDATNGKEPDGVRHEKDGDTHGWLKLDPEFEDLLNPGNLSQEGGNMVFEVVCRFNVTQTDAVAACTNFSASVTIPKIGSHVRIVGTYVRDTNHAQWMEIHPVTSISVIP